MQGDNRFAVCVRSSRIMRCIMMIVCTRMCCSDRVHRQPSPRGSQRGEQHSVYVCVWPVWAPIYIDLVNKTKMTVHVPNMTSLVLSVTHHRPLPVGVWLPLGHSVHAVSVCVYCVGPLCVLCCVRCLCITVPPYLDLQVTFPFLKNVSLTG